MRGVGLPLFGRFFAAEAATRVAAIDLIRGGAIVLMMLYHACWDTTWFGLTRFDLLGNPYWLAARTLIVSLFLGLVGISLVLANRDGVRSGNVVRRLLVIVAAAVAITIVTAWIMPDSFIFFGVLHHIAVASILGLVFIELPVVLTFAASVFFLTLPEMVAWPVFDSPWLIWIGLGTGAPRSNDFVPLFPWFGVVLAGIGLGRLMVRAPGYGRLGILTEWRPVFAPLRALRFAGRHSLSVYLLHQPVLFGAIWLVAQVSGAGGLGADTAALRTEPGMAVAPRTEGFLSSCQVNCEQAGASFTRCAGYCRCVVDDLRGRSLWVRFRENHLDDTGKAAVVEVVKACATRQP